MKRLVILAMAVIGLLGCSKITDTPVINFEESSYTVSVKGGELIIPVNSTGIDDVVITYKGGENWEVDSTTGDRTPTVGWCQLVRVIEHYEQDTKTRDLAQWTSAIELQIEPNSTDYERVAYITVKSFSKEATVMVKQGF